MQILTVGAISKMLGIPKHRLYYMEEMGKIPAAERSGDGRRYYTLNDVDRLRRLLAKRPKRR